MKKTIEELMQKVHLEIEQIVLKMNDTEVTYSTALHLNEYIALYQNLKATLDAMGD